jgi:VWFA-related protein
MRLFGLSAALIFAIVLDPAARQAPPQPPQAPTFRVAVDYVEVDAVVTDRDGKFVGGLTKDDFEVLEDGKPQTISAFTLVDLPVRRPAPPAFRGTPVEPDVRTNAGEFNGRVMVLVLDDLLVDAKRTLKVRAAAKEFINKHVSENDLVAVLNTGRSTSSQNFTNNRALLLAAVDRFVGSRLKSIAMATMEYFQMTNEAVDPHAQERPVRTRDALGRLKNAAEYLANVRGRRKALIWFSEGVDFNLDDPMLRDAPLVRDAMAELMGTAQRSGVSFYALDPRGLGAGLDDNTGISLPEDLQSPIGMQSVLSEVRFTQGSLHTISNETGGFAVVGGGDINNHFDRIVEENSSYYLLGYYPASDKKDGKVRSLDVRVKRPGLRVRSRKAYTAPRSGTSNRSTAAAANKASPELRAAIESPIPMAAVPMRVFAAPFLGPSKKGSVAIIIEFDPSGFRFQEQAGTFNENLEILIVPINAAGKALDGARDEAPLKLSAKSHELVRANGVRIARRLDLPPGRYQLHIAAQSGNSKAVGALNYDLEVPDFEKAPLGMSGIALMSTGADRIPTPKPAKDFMDVLPMAATAIRDFDRSDTLFLFTEIYPRRSGTPHAVQIVTTVTSDDGKVRLRKTDERKTAEMKTEDAGFGHSARFPLTDFSPGRYVLRIEAKVLTAEGAVAARELEFRVR